MYHVADLPGAEVDGVNLIVVANDNTDLSVTPSLISVKDLNLAVRRETK